MVKRQSRESAKDRKGSENLSDNDQKKDKKRTRRASEDVKWVKDTTLIIEDSDDDDSTYVDESDSSMELNFTIELNDPKGSQYDQFLDNLLKKHYPQKKQAKNTGIKPNIQLSETEMTYFKTLSRAKQRDLNILMKSVTSSTCNADIPLKFQVISLPVSDYIKNSVIKKINMIDDDTGEAYKLRSWLDGFMKIPFGKVIPLPVCLEDGRDKCSKFIKESKQIMDDAVFGMNNAKTQVLQVLAQWVANPVSIGNVIMLQGPPGTGKTSLSKNGISKALKRPFEFFSLGGASDISVFTGHSYTYEGSMWGRIVDCLMKSKCMNPVIYFDEIDKVSDTAHGEEIINMLIHLTDRTQNMEFHDRYFAGIDLDLSQCLFVFSCNDINKINPVLKDRMQVITCSGYSETEKCKILKDYVWPQLLERLRFNKNDLILEEGCMKFIISQYSSKEQGVRTLMRTVETIITRINMLRIADDELMKEYKFYIDVKFPMILTEQHVKTLLSDIEARKHEAWESMYN
jgi:ATP-dependent Lon protease